MAPEIVCSFIKEAKKPIRILDPMMGSGTVVALAQSRKHHAIGVDIDPLATLIARVWTAPVNSESVRQKAVQVLERATQRYKGVRAAGAFPINADTATREFIEYWFDGWARRQLFCLSEAIRRIHDSKTREVLWCAFSRLIIAKQAGASRALDLSHSRPHRHFKVGPLKPFPNFLQSVEHVLRNVPSKHERFRGKRVRVEMGDARRLRLKDSSIDMVLTSPPYLNAIDYIRCSKFTLVWMGYSVKDLRVLRSESVGTENGRSCESDPQIVRVIRTLRISRLSKRMRNIIGAYIYDMRAALREVERVLVSGGTAIYVVGENTIRGSYIRNSAMLRLVAKEVGLRLMATTRRRLPPNRRYMPPPAQGDRMMDSRMRSEVILHFAKP
jgi:DNA modification methylase